MPIMNTTLLTRRAPSRARRAAHDLLDDLAVVRWR
jgi:hypothetical protein